MSRIRRTLLRTVAGIALAVGLTAGLGVPEAQAQMRVGARMGGGGFGLEKVTSSDVDRYIKILDLSKAQQDALKALHEAYESDYGAAEKALADKLEKIQQDFQDTQDPSVWQGAGDAQEKFQTKSSEVNKQFVGDLKALLTSEQSAKWPTAERANRRAKSLSGGFAGFGMGLAGESVDLIKMVEDLKLAKQSSALSQVLEKYETEIDSAIVARDTRRKELGEAMQNEQRNRMKDGGGMMPDFSKLQGQMAELRKVGIPVRDINDRYSTLIASSLPDDQRDDFGKKYKKAKFPNIYNEPYAMKAINAAKGFKDLTDEQRSGIDEIVTSYQRDVAAANDRYCKAQTDAEKDGGGDDIMSGVMRMMGGGDGKDESELSQAKKARRKLDSDALDKLKGLLTEDQKSRLPERETDMFQWGAPRRR